jgi:hypothetical protein
MLLQNAAMFAEAQNQTWLADAWCKCGEPSVFLSKRDIREDGSGKRAPQRDIGVYRLTRLGCAKIPDFREA